MLCRQYRYEAQPLLDAIQADQDIATLLLDMINQSLIELDLHQ